MMRYFRCCKCKAAYKVAKVDPSVHLLEKGLLTCAVCRYTVKEEKLGKSKASDFTYCSAIDLWTACQGMGMGEEKNCSVRRVTSALVNKKISSINVEPVDGENRCLIDSITLDDGTTVHLSTSTIGVVVYKITKEKKHERSTSAR